MKQPLPQTGFFYLDKQQSTFPGRPGISNWILKYSLPLLFIFGGLLSSHAQQNVSSSTISSGSSNWSNPGGITVVKVEVWGGGGGGGGVDGGSSNTRAGGGGGGGGYTVHTNFSVGASVAYVVGAAGSAGSNTTDGGNGGDTNFGTVIAKGGKGGKHAESGAASGAGGAGATIGSGGSVPGTLGGNGGSVTGDTNDATSGSGPGGGSGGGGGDGQPGNTATGIGGAAGAGPSPGAKGADGRATAGTGSPGVVPGSGGSGAWQQNSNTNQAGGAGALGQIIITITRPSAPGTPTAVAGPTINSVENAGFSVVVPSLNTTGGVVGDILTLYQDGVSIGTHALAAGDLLTPFNYTFTGVTLTGGDGVKNLTATVSNANLGLTSAPLALTLDTTSPTVSNVDSSTPNGTYRFGAQISIQVTFSAAVTVTGTPQLLLETGAVDRTADYSSGSGTTTLTFLYTVQDNDVSGDLNYGTTGALSLNSGTILSAIGNPATLTLPATGGGSSLGGNKALVVDGASPVVTGVTSTKPDGSYGAGTIIPITVTFHTAVDVAGGPPKIQLETGTTDQQVDYTSGTGTTVLTFNYTVQVGDLTADLDFKATNSLTLGGGTIKRAASATNAILTLPAVGGPNSIAGTKALNIDGTSPTVTGVTSSTPNGTYRFGQQISIQVTFSKSVTVTGGPPQLLLETGTTDRQVNYTSGSPGTVLTFLYTVQDGDNSGDLDYQSNAALTLNGATIVDAFGNNANLTLANPGAAGSIAQAKALVVDGLSPLVLSVTSTKPDGTYGIGTSIPITVTFSTAVDVAGGPPRILLETGAVDQQVNYTSGTGTAVLTFNYIVQANDVSADLDYQSTGALTLNGGTIQRAAAATPAILTLVAPGAVGSIANGKAIVVDGVRPVATAPISAAQILKAAAVSTSNIRSTKAGDIYLVRNSVAVANNFANITAALGTQTAFLAKSGAAANTSYFVTVPSAATAIDGTYDIVAVDAVGNVSNQVAGWLTIDNTAPLAATAPTSTAAPTVDGIEYTAGITVTATGLSTTGAQNNDVIELLIGGVSFPTPLTHPLTTLEISGDTYAFTVACGQLGADAVGKQITTRITDVAGNVGAISPALSLDVSTTPTVAASSLSFGTTTTTSTIVNFTNGDGAFRIVVASVGTPVTFNPSNFTAYPANNNYAAAVDLGGGQKVVATASGATITNLPSGNNIYFKVFEFSNCSPRERYLTASTLSGFTLVPAAANTVLQSGGGVAAVSSVTDTKAEGIAATASFSFTVKDDGASNGVDNAPTIINSLVIRRDVANDQTVDWTGVIAGVVLTDGTNSINSVDDPGSFAGFLAPDQITISSIPALLGTIADNSPKSYQLKVWFRTDIASFIAIDNRKLVFNLDDSDVTTAATGSSAMAASFVTSGSLNNSIQVVADRLAFTSAPAGGTAGTAFPISVAARDANANVDLDMNQQVTLTAPTVPGGGALSFATATPAAAAANLSSGVLTWTGVKVTAGGNYVFRISDTDATAPAMTLANTGTINFGAASSSSDVIENLSFVYPGLIPYASFQHATPFAVGPPPGDAIKVAEFIIRDGGVLLTDLDDIGTTLTDITFNVINPGNIRYVGLWDGTNIVASQPGGSTVTFSGLSLLAEDVANGGTATKTFGLYVSFVAPAVDEQHFGFQITNVLTGSGGSGFAAANGGGAQSTTSIGLNRVNVVASILRFIAQPSNTDIDVNMSAVTYEAVDALSSRDFGIDGVLVTTTSTGVPAAQAGVNLNNGFASNAAINHTDKGTALTLSATAGGLTPTGASNPFNITASAASDIVVDNTVNAPFFTGVPADILYANYQAANITGGSNDIAVAQFAIRDGGGSNDSDLGGTLLKDITFSVANSTALRRVALYDDAGFELQEVAAGPTVTFTNLMAGAGYGPGDFAQKRFTIRVSFQNSAAFITDNASFQFTITNATTTSKSSDFISASAGGAASSVAGNNNHIEAVASQYVFTTAPTAPIFAGNPFPSPVVAEARDANNVKDLDYNNFAYIGTNDLALGGFIKMSDAAGHTNVDYYTQNFVNGVLTLDAQLHYDNRSASGAPGNGSFFIQEGPSFAWILTFAETINVSANSDIIEATPISYYTQNINYLTYQAPAIDLTSAGNELLVAKFTLRDGGTGADADGVGTELTSITFNVANPTFLNQLALYKGPLESDRLAANVTVSGSSTVTFNGFALTAPDGGTATLNLYATFNNVITDNVKLAFGVNSASVNTLTSTLTTGLTGNAGGAITTNPGTDDNRLEVTASKLNFTPSINPAGINVLINQTLNVNVKADDINGNIDLDFNSSVSSVTQAVTTSPSPATSGTFVNGQLPFSYQYLTATPATAGNGTLTMAAGPLTGQLSPVINVSASFESRLYFDPLLGSYSANIDYSQHQQTSNPNTFILGRMLLGDGDAVGGPTDLDLAPTVLTSFQISVTNPNAIRRIALYDNAGVEIGSTETGGASPITFSGLNITAPDDGSTAFTIRASFNNTAGAITDNQQITMQVLAATTGVGSNFAPGIGGVSGGSASPSSVNFIEVTATKLDFVQQPGPFAGVNEVIVTPGIVHATDQNDLLDLDFGAAATITAPGAGVSGTFGFTAGVLDLTNVLTYNSEGKGTLSVFSGGLVSTNPPATAFGLPQTAHPCTTVEVIQLTTTNTFSGISTTNLLAGSANKVVFGFTFNSAYSPGADPSLQSFVISFNQSITNIYQNIRVFEGTTPAYPSGGTGLTNLNVTPGVTVDLSNSSKITVSFATPKYIAAGSQWTYFVVVDVNILVNGSTPAITASVTDAGTGTLTAPNIVVNPNRGSQFSNTVGKTINFSSIAPPTLVTTYPAVGQLDIDVTQPTIDLTFSVPTVSLDGKVILTEKGGPSYTLSNANGTPCFCASEFGNGAPTLKFTIPVGTLLPNKEYSVTIANGQLNGPTNSTGIMDENKNLFPGISSPGALYFRTTNIAPPKLLATTTTPAAPTDPIVTDIALDGATLNATFDKIGTAFYMVLGNALNPPTSREIKGLDPYSASPVVARGQINITSTTTVSQFGIITPTGGPGPGGQFLSGNYYVWICADAKSEASGAAVPNSLLESAPYGGTPGFSELTAGGVGPTLSFFVGSSAGPALPSSNTPSINICSNSYQILNTPIIISEGSGPTGKFQAAGTQTFNLVLPAGFQFDVSRNGVGAPLYGNLTLQGTDFVSGSGALTFLSNSILKVSYSNTGNTSSDKIIISGLRVISTGSPTGSIFRLGGNAIPNITDGTTVAALSSFDAGAISFDNTYSSSVFNTVMPNVETAIPDNASPSSITLTPFIPAPAGNYDFGPSTFTGQGVSGNTLNIIGVTVDTPFNITITHTDNNGCISTNPVQHVVYNHKRAINITNPLKTPDPLITPSTLDQGPYCVNSNVDFQIDATIPLTSTTGLTRNITFDNLSGYYMESMTADIPIGSTAPISGPNWGAIIRNSLLVQGTQHNISTINYYDYSFSDKVIINAHQTDPAITYPYDYFKSITDPPINPLKHTPQTYYKGGSLGTVEFTGTFRNISNPTVVIRRKQIVEFVMPAVPVVEIVSDHAYMDTSDPLNMPGDYNRPGNPGTPVFCTGGGLIIINGWPKVLPNTAASGTFKLYDRQSGTQITNPGFIDNTNGTASLDPSVVGLQNLFRDIRIEYEYKDDASSPICSAIGVQMIRISPNPIASFTRFNATAADATTGAPAALIVSPYTSGTTTFCESQVVVFDGSGSSVPSGAGTIQSYAWDFDDGPNSVGTGVFDITPPPPGGSISNPNNLTGVKAYHFFKQSRTSYQPFLKVTSNFNCVSAPAIVPTEVGAVPSVKIKFDGVHAGSSASDQFSFQSDNSTVSSNDDIAKLDWDFGDGTGIQTVSGLPNDIAFNAFVKTHNYTTTGEKVVNMTLTTRIGCMNSLLLTNTLAKGMSSADDQLTRTLVVLPRVTVTPANAYKEDFDTTSVSANWRVWYTGTYNPGPPSNPNTVKSADRSWAFGLPNKTQMAMDPNTPTVVGARAWSTSLTGTYNPFERSAVYSPAFDLSALARPMISLDTYKQMEVADGVVLQYSVDNKNVVDATKVWKTLGDQQDGEFWFTDKGIAAKPGDQIGNDFGWSGTKDSLWVASKHALTEQVSGIPVIINAPNVVFRLALASAVANIRYEGFAFDNVRIGERTRTILLESFTSASNAARSQYTALSPGPNNLSDEQYENDVIAKFNSTTVGLEVVKLNYHVNFPADDPFNLNNPADPSSRALFYNIEQTPQSRLDGYFPAPYTPFSQWGANSFGTRTLHLAQADIIIRPTSGSASNKADYVKGGKVSVMIDIVPTVNLNAKTILHVGIVEQLVPKGSLSTAAQGLVLSKETQWEYVLKKLLPTASGTRTSTHAQAVSGNLIAGTKQAPKTYTFGPFEFVPDQSKFYAPSLSDLGIVAFLQKEDGDKEVYQAEIVKDLDDPAPNVVTGLEPVYAEDVKVYPVPAHNEMHVMMPGRLTDTAPIELIDQTGRTALQSAIQAGESRTTLNTMDLASGVYILQINVGNGNFTRKKVMVVHDGN